MKSGDLGDAPETMIDDLLIPLHKFHRAKQQQQQLQNQQPPRSKSSDILKNNMSGGDLSATGKSQTFSSHFNSLKQWGKNRLRMKVRGMEQHQQQQQQQFNSDQNQQQMQLYSSMVTFANQNNSNNGHGDGMAKKVVSDIDNGFNGQAETAAGGSSSTRRRPMDRALSHERKPSYSSSERSLPLSISSHTTATTSSPTLPASINPVKMRESAAIRRQRRIGLGYKEEPNNSSSGNWSASSESGRTSIGSEITVQPKSSASSQSLNHMNHHPGSGPPSSVISRRRFFNTSASSSVTSEGTATPEQMQELMFDDMETSSAYSCDTEGYYTSFHVDSGLKTLKEEEPSTPLHVSSALSSTNSFSSGNQTVVENENEYELFGRGSTSTTASSAGTICTMLMGGGGSDRSSIGGGGGGGPMVPERKSSLTKLNRSNSTTSSSNRNSMEPLERSRSSSTMGSASTLDRMGTIKRNGVLLPKEISVVIKSSATAAAAVATTGGTTKGDVRLDSPDSGNNTSTSPVESNSNSISPPALRSGSSEFEYSESSDQETMDRSERIRTKTTINSSRIPSMCVITPSNSSDDETTIRQEIKSPSPPPPSTREVRAKLATPLMSEKRKKLAVIETDLDQLDYQTPPPTTVIVNDLKKDQVQHVKKTTLLPLNNVLGRLKGVIPHLNRKSPLKSPGGSSVPVPAEQIYDVAGEYVTISDANRRGTGGYYANAKTVKNNLAAVLSGRQLNDETEYVSLNELPSNIRCERPLANEQNSSTSTKSSNLLAPSPSSSTTRGAAAAAEASNNNNKALGARVTLDAQGKVIYNSDSLKRRKGAHTTFAPGPCVKESATATADNENNNGVQLRTPVLGRPERRVSLERNGATAAENPPPSPKVDNHRISANRNIILAGLIKHPGGGCGGSGGAVPVSANNSLASVSEVGTDKGQQTTTPTYHSTTLKSFSQPAATATPLLSPLEEDEGLHLLKMIPNSMGPLKNSGAYSTLPKLSSSSSGSGSGSALASPQPGKSSPHPNKPLLRIIDNLQTHCKGSSVGGVEDADGGYSLLSNLTSNNNNNNNSHSRNSANVINCNNLSKQCLLESSASVKCSGGGGGGEVEGSGGVVGNLIRRNSYGLANDFDLEDEKFMANLESHLILPRYLSNGNTDFLMELRASRDADAKKRINGVNGVEGAAVRRKKMNRDGSESDAEADFDDEFDEEGEEGELLADNTQKKHILFSAGAAAEALLLSPRKVIIPADRFQHRAKILSPTRMDTEIW